MKKLTILLMATILSLSLSAQNVEEPVFIGEAKMLNADDTGTLLEKSTIQLQVQSTGFTVVTKMVLPGCCARVRAQSGNLQIIVRAVDNNSDPLSIIQVIKFDSKKKKRTAELSSASGWTAKSGKLKLVPFSGAKYGTNSYLLTITGIGAGEYGITVSNPNVRDEKVTVVSCFGID